MHLNRDSLIHMARRQVKSILASGHKSNLLKKIADYLQNIMPDLEAADTSEALKEYQDLLELTQAALTHLWISPPYNGILFVPRSLSAEQIQKLLDMLQPKKKNHLRIAYSDAA